MKVTVLLIHELNAKRTQETDQLAEPNCNNTSLRFENSRDGCNSIIYIFMMADARSMTKSMRACSLDVASHPGERWNLRFRHL